MVDRIKKVMEKRGLTPSQFADEIDLKRSSLSHILSGRNNPSLDVVMKIKARFDEISTDWLLFGTGNEVAKKTEKVDQKEVLTEVKPQDKGQQLLTFEAPVSAKPKENVTSEMSQPLKSTLIPDSKTKQAVKLLLIYSDNSFESFDQR